MKKIELYTKSYCPFCRRAKELLQIKGVDFIEYDVTDDLDKEAEMRQRAGRKTVPEIFIDNQLVGGCDDLFSLDEKGDLDALLA
jgi:glutaredoxin 3